MSPVNLALRFLLELAALASMATWGWSRAAGGWRVLAAVAGVVVPAALWGVFAVPGDPSRGGQGVVAVPGLARLLLELAFFGAAAWALWSTGRTTLATAFAITVSGGSPRRPECTAPTSAAEGWSGVRSSTTWRAPWARRSSRGPGTERW